jgi:hypothetical protein
MSGQSSERTRLADDRATSDLRVESLNIGHENVRSEPGQASTSGTPLALLHSSVGAPGWVTVGCARVCLGHVDRLFKRAHDRQTHRSGTRVLWAVL